ASHAVDAALLMAVEAMHAAIGPRQLGKLAGHLCRLFLRKLHRDFAREHVLQRRAESLRDGRQIELVQDAQLGFFHPANVFVSNWHSPLLMCVSATRFRVARPARRAILARAAAAAAL